MFAPDNIIIYLRKSRADNPDETVEEVLRKHYTILQDFCQKEYGFRVPERNIYREVVSGESIEDRIEIKRVLERIESPDVRAVAVVDPQRLSRGDLIDCGTLVNALQYTGTLVITPYITYHLDNKMERRFLQDELLRGHDYLEYTKEILSRGKLAAVRRGCFVQPRAPYGYDRVREGKDYTLAPNADADTVRLIFDRFVTGASSWSICRELERLGIKSPTGRDDWQCGTVDKMIKNEHYIGKVVYQKSARATAFEGGKKTHKRENIKEGYIVADGKHPPIVEEKTFVRAQEIMGSRPPLKSDRPLRNAFAGVARCAQCGTPLIYKEKRGKDRYLVCKTQGCSRAVRYELMIDTVAKTLEAVQLPDLVARQERGEGDSNAIRERMIASMEGELAELKAQEQKQYELLERGVYSDEIFLERNRAVHERMAKLAAGIEEARRNTPPQIDFAERIFTLSGTIAALRDLCSGDTCDTAAANRLLRSIINRIDVFSPRSDHYKAAALSLDISLRL